MTGPLALIHPLLAAGGNACGTNNGFLPGLYDGLCSGGNVQIQSASDVWVIVANAIRIVMAASGGLAVIFIIVAGIMYTIASGDPGRLKQAREVLVQAITGLVIVSISYAVITFIAQGF
ncbi:MAG TPA: hypothetical protein VLI05_06035 [Candidatus Saccharimonadia bacterium]|nr:hypothetical protein [Candidatus Saccharimonadia bacterium]